MKNAQMQSKTSKGVSSKFVKKLYECLGLNSSLTLIRIILLLWKKQLGPSWTCMYWRLHPVLQRIKKRVSGELDYSNNLILVSKVDSQLFMHLTHNIKSILKVKVVSFQYNQWLSYNTKKLYRVVPTPSSDAFTWKTGASRLSIYAVPSSLNPAVIPDD